MLSELFPIPFQIASVEAIAEMLAEWDIAQTEMLMKKLELAKEQRLEQERKRQEAQARKVPKKKADHSTDEEPAEGALTGKPGWWEQVGFNAVRSLWCVRAASLIVGSWGTDGCKLASTQYGHSPVAAQQA